MSTRYATNMTWITFGAAAGMLGLAIAGLTVHELTTERVVHSLESADERERRHDEVYA